MRTFKLPATGFPFNITKEILTTDFYEHSHEFFEMVVVFSGMAGHYVNGQENNLRAGDIYVLNSENSHEFRDVSGIGFFNVVFSQEMLFSFGPEIRKIPGFHPLFITGPSQAGLPFKCKLHLSGADFVKVIETLDGIMRDFTEKSDGFEVVIRAEFISLAVFLSRKYTETNPADDSGRGGLMRLANAVSHMERNYTRKITLEELASICGLSVRQFTRLFRTYYEKSPMEYVIFLRIELAAELLRGTKKSVTEVALDTGFYDSSSFCRYFKKIMGQPPERFRNRSFLSSGISAAPNPDVS